MAEPIEIIIRQGGQGGVGFGSGTGGAIGNQPSSAALSRGAGFGKEGQNLIANAVIDSRIVAALQNQLKSTVMYSISNYGNMTGDYIGQQQINNALGMIGDVITIGAATAKGGYIGLALSTFAVAAKKSVELFNLRINIAKQNTQASYMRERSGNSLNNGSSGTYE